MALKLRKLSEIAAAPAPPALTDTLVGVGGGATDYQYTLQQVKQIGTLPPVSQDPRFVSAPTNALELFVATTGDDNNPGTQAQPFLTVQQAIDVATSFDYEDKYSPSISVAAGTYVVPNSLGIVVPELFRMGQFAVGTIFGAGMGSTIINAQGKICAFFCQSTTLSNWSIQLLSIDCAAKCVRVFGTADMFLFGVEFLDSSAGSAMVCMFGQDYAIMEMQNCVVSATTFTALIMCRFLAHAFCIGTLTLPVASTVGEGFISCLQQSYCQFNPSSITNAGGVTGPQLNLHESSGVFTNNGLLSDIPGTTTGSVDVTSYIAQQGSTFPFSTSTKASFFAQQFAGIPANTDISAGCWTVVKDTSGGGVYVLYNDAGTIKKVALT